MKILVTGAKGQLGSSIRENAVQFPEHEILYTDIEELDILDEQSVEDFLRSEKPGLLINCAAYTAVDRAEEFISDAEALNIRAPGILAGQMNRIGGSMVHISTDYVFNGTGTDAYREDDPVNPDSVYGKTKAEGEKLVLGYQGNYIIRTSWLYSEYGNNFFRTMLRLFNEKDEVNVVSDQVGTPTYAGDLAMALLRIAGRLSDSGAEPGIYHFSNEGKASWYEFAKEIAKLSGAGCRVNPIPTSAYPTPAKRPQNSILGKEKIKKTFGLIIPDWRDSLKLCYDSYVKL